jgi:S1-C subfamily serine protease
VENLKDVFYAVSANDVYKSYESFLINQNVKVADSAKGLLGVNYEMITALDAYIDNKEITSGAIIVQPQTFEEQSAFAKTLAAKSGIQGNDIIIMVGNDNVDEKNNLSRLMYKNKDEQIIMLKVLRDDELLTIEVMKE